MNTHDDEIISRMLSQCRAIAVVGLSANPERDSYQVARYLQNEGYRIVPVNPTYAGQTILGELCHASLQGAADQLALSGQQIDMVDCFRRSEAMPGIAADAIEIGARCIWMQLGVINEAAATTARAAGLAVVMDRCTKIELAYR